MVRSSSPCHMSKCPSLSYGHMLLARHLGNHDGSVQYVAIVVEGGGASTSPCNSELRLAAEFTSRPSAPTTPMDSMRATRLWSEEGRQSSRNTPVILGTSLVLGRMPPNQRLASSAVVWSPTYLSVRSISGSLQLPLSGHSQYLWLRVSAAVRHLLHWLSQGA